MDWSERVDELLFAGEKRRETVDTAGARVVVTTHRVLAFSGIGQQNFWQVDLPNVTGVRSRNATDHDLLTRALVTGVTGVFLVGMAQLFASSSIVANLTGNDLSDGGIGVIDAMQLLVDLFGQLTTLFLQVGSALVVLAGLFGVLYWHRRTPTLVISVAGDPDIELSWATDPGDAVDTLDQAIFERAR